METVTEEHNLDIETMRLSRLPLEAEAQTGDSASQQLADSAIKDHVGYSVVANANPGSSSSSPSEPSIDTTKSGFSVASSGGHPSKEQLRQLRAQCLIFLAFKNGLVPKKLHLEIALGNIYFKEGTERASFYTTHPIEEG